MSVNNRNLLSLRFCHLLQTVNLNRGGPVINTDVFNQIKAKRKIITEEEQARTKAFIEDDGHKVESDTISRNLFKKTKLRAFNLNDRK